MSAERPSRPDNVRSDPKREIPMISGYISALWHYVFLKALADLVLVLLLLFLFYGFGWLLSWAGSAVSWMFEPVHVRYSISILGFSYLVAIIITTTKRFLEVMSKWNERKAASPQEDTAS